jgi:hypothetical protein
MKWRVIHAKVREEFRALENLKAQGFCQLAKFSRNSRKNSFGHRTFVPEMLIHPFI